MADSTMLMARFLALHPKKIDLSLSRMEQILPKLGNPQHRLPKTIHVAGTNGKGSTIAFMRAILEASGRTVHVYTSPHLVRFHERIRLTGRLVDEATLVAAFKRCEDANGGAPITVFEMTTAAALLLFAETPADVLLLEVGLGGRFDATNVIDSPAATVITPVSLDHMEYLGDTITKIAGEKAGILKRGSPAIFAEQSAEGLAVLDREARRKRTGAVHVGGQDFRYRRHDGPAIAAPWGTAPAPERRDRHCGAQGGLWRGDHTGPCRHRADNRGLAGASATPRRQHAETGSGGVRGLAGWRPQSGRRTCPVRGHGRDAVA
jgi:dihydrofolate synthase / folylpolyglutamate synthase